MSNLDCLQILFHHRDHTFYVSFHHSKLDKHDQFAESSHLHTLLTQELACLDEIVQKVYDIAVLFPLQQPICKNDNNARYISRNSQNCIIISFINISTIHFILKVYSCVKETFVNIRGIVFFCKFLFIIKEFLQTMPREGI